MKNIKLLSLFALLSVGALFLTNCSGTEGEDVAPKPTLNFLGGAEYIDEDVSLAAKTDFAIAVTANHTANIKTFKITLSINGSADLPILDSAMSDKAITEYVYNGTTADAEGTEVYTFSVADKDGNTTTKTITITNIGDGGSDLITLTEDNDGNPFRVYNFRGAEKGAYQIGGGPLSSSDPNSQKDIQDSTDLGELPNWPARWTSRNGTTFKTAPASAWAAITNDAGIEAAWDAAGGAVSVIEVVKGENYLLNIANSGRYALVNITDVVETTGDNSDYVEFTYKYQEQ